MPIIFFEEKIMLHLSDLTNIQPKLSNSGRKVHLPPMSTQLAQSKAQELLAQGLPPSLWRAVELLSMGGVMTAAQMGISPRTLRRYRDRRVIDRLPHATPTVVETFRQYELPIPQKQHALSLYALGPVGSVISKQRYAVKPPGGYLSYPLNRIMHDVIVNMIVMRIAQEAIQMGWQAIWMSKYAATLYREKQAVLEPDALLRLKHPIQGEWLYAVEYHNEDKSTRAVQKIRKYESAHYNGMWAQGWDCEYFPTVLVVYRHVIVGQGYHEASLNRANLKGAYYGRSLSRGLEKIDDWYYFNTQQRENIWPWLQGEA